METPLYRVDIDRAGITVKVEEVLWKALCYHDLPHAQAPHLELLSPCCQRSLVDLTDFEGGLSCPNCRQDVYREAPNEILLSHTYDSRREWLAQGEELMESWIALGVPDPTHRPLLDAQVGANLTPWFEERVRGHRGFRGWR